MKYIIHCLLKGEVERYHHELVNDIAERFGLSITKEENLATHFPLKYPFETENIEEIDKIIEEFCKSRKRTPVRVGGFCSFPPKVIFIDVQLSEEAKKTFLQLIDELRKVKWLPWEPYEGENLHFHATIAEECDERFSDVWNFVQGKERYFDCWFDNITILKLVGGTQYFGTWEIHKIYSTKR